MKDEDLIVRYKGWLSKEDFSKMIEIADYLGKDLGAIAFRLSKEKIMRNNLTVDEVLSILDDIGIEYSDALVETLNKVLSKNLGRAVISFDGAKIYVKFDRFIGETYHNKLKNLLKYDFKSKAFYTYPFNYFKTKNILKELGFTVEDLTGFKETNALPLKVEFKGSLREYQKEALDAWWKASGQGIIALPTGAGKTVVGIAALSLVNEATLIIAYTKEQLMQWEKFIVKFTNLSPSLIGLYYSEEKKLAPITLATYQTAYRYMSKLAPYFSLLIIDEVHHLPADKFRHIAITSPAKFRMGLSATPYREDGKHEDLFPLMGGVVYYKSPYELAEMGYLARYRVVTIRVELKGEEKKRYLELRKAFKELSGGLDFKTLVDLAKSGNQRAIQALKVHSEIMKILSTCRAKVDKVKELVEREVAEGRKVIVFAHYVSLAEEIAKETNAYLLTGELDEARRRSILEQFKNAKSGVLVVTTVGDEGIDIPDASVGIFVAGTGSRRQFIQRLGRLLRPQPGKEAVLYEVVVKGTSEELQSRRRKTLSLEDLADVDESSD